MIWLFKESFQNKPLIKFFVQQHNRTYLFKSISNKTYLHITCTAVDYADSFIRKCYLIRAREAILYCSVRDGELQNVNNNKKKVAIPARGLI